MDIRIRSGHENGAVIIGLEVEGEIKSQIVFPVGMAALVAEAALSTERIAREEKGRIIQPKINLTGGKHE